MPGTEEHDISIKGRKFIEVTGVTSVESFDVTAFALQTNGGPLNIEGANLHMKHLDLDAGVVSIEGTVNRLDYTVDTKSRKKFGKNLFR